MELNPRQDEAAMKSMNQETRWTLGEVVPMAVSPGRSRRVPVVDVDPVG